jgi:hypothetical protein
MSKMEILQAASFRSKNRLPAVTYCHKQTEAVLIRSAQPMLGIVHRKCAEDELLLDNYRMKGMESLARFLSMTYCRLTLNYYFLKRQKLQLPQ